MFRAAAAGPFDEGVAKATDENLTSEDWGAIIEVCDRVGSDQNGPKEVVQAMIKRLAHRNANVQLYTLELANALSQNCGKNMHQELSSRAFTDAMLKLANDRNTHNQVKAKILERMKEWSDMFSKDADLGIMYDAYFRLKQSNPTLQAPSAPQKTGLTDLDRQKEEDELQMALKLSLQDEERKKKAAEPVASSSSAAPGSSSQPQPQPQSQPTPVPAGTTAATVSRVRALYDFVPSEPGELEFKKGDVIAVLESVYKDWWRGSLKGKTGIFPLNYVEKLTDPTPDELAREAQMEAEVFAEIKNVEKLLTLLSTSNTAPREEDNEEISKLYHQTLAIRPKLIKLIEKYSQKKDDFTQLNEKFIKARRDYESLLESSMSHPPQPSYHQYAMRSGPGGYPGPAGPAAGYPAQGPPQQQQEQRFYTPAPQEQPQYPQSTPSPNFQRPAQATPAPFYVAGAEVPSAGGPPPAQNHPYPQREHNPRLPSTGKAPAPINTSPPTANAYTAYSQPPNQRPQSTYGAQELATSVYDSPIAAHNPSSAATYTSSVYSQDDPYNSNNTSSPAVGNTTVPAPPPSSFQPSAPTAQPSQPSAPSAPQQPQYQSYQPPGTQGQDNYNNAPTQAPPPVPTGAAPPIPGPARSEVLTPPPLQPGGAAYDARQSLPSQGAQPQYRAYVPPGAAADGPSAPPARDYYRQSGVY